MTTIAPFELNYRPQLPAKADYGIGIVGCGGIVNYGHSPAYEAHGFNRIGGYDINPEAVTRTEQEHGLEKGI